jgi:hypothetical protein
VTVTLWHPDNGQPFQSWRVGPGETLRLLHDGAPINIGSDWGVQLGDSEVKPVFRVSAWNSGSRRWIVSTDDFFR